MFLTYILPIGSMSYTYARVGCELWGSQSIGECTQRQLENIKSKRRVSGAVTKRDCARGCYRNGGSLWQQRRRLDEQQRCFCGSVLSRSTTVISYYVNYEAVISFSSRHSRPCEWISWWAHRLIVIIHGIVIFRRLGVRIVVDKCLVVIS